MQPIFQHETPLKDEWDTGKRIRAMRRPNGEVEIRISTWTERSDEEYKPYVLPLDEAERFGRALCCIDDDTFDGPADRAKEMS